MQVDMADSAAKKLDYLMQHGYEIKGVYVERINHMEGKSSGTVDIYGRCKWFPYKEYNKNYEEVVRSNN